MSIPVPVFDMCPLTMLCKLCRSFQSARASAALRQTHIAITREIGLPAALEVAVIIRDLYPRPHPYSPWPSQCSSEEARSAAHLTLCRAYPSASTRTEVCSRCARHARRLRQRSHVFAQDHFGAGRAGSSRDVSSIYTFNYPLCLSFIYTRLSDRSRQTARTTKMRPGFSRCIAMQPPNSLRPRHSISRLCERLCP